MSCDVGLTCDIIDKSFYKPIVVAPTNPSCSTTTSTSPLSDGLTSDTSLMVENENLKKEVNELTRALGNAYGGEAHLLKCLGSQRFSLNKEGLGYTPKKGKAAFVTPKASFVKGNGRFCNRCKQVGHIEQYCKTNKNKQPNVYREDSPTVPSASYTEKTGFHRVTEHWSRSDWTLGPASG